MKRTRTIFLLAVTVAGAAPAAAHGAPSCRVPGGRVLKTGEIARLISVPTPSGAALYACIRRTGRKIGLDASYSHARLTGRWVAWQRAGTEGRWRIAVHDLRTGRERLVNGHVAERSLGLSARGSIVWAQQQNDSPKTPLFANDVVGGGRLLDGGDVDARSVRLAGRRVSWRSSGVPLAAVIR